MRREHRGRALLCALALATSASADTLPDWSGWWTLPQRVIDEWNTVPPPLPAETLARFRAGRRDDSNPDPGRFCRPQQFTGYSGGFTEAVEFLFTPGRVTLTNEAGLIRRIYTDGRALPEDPDNSNVGTSVPIGSNVRITERMTLLDPSRLQFEIVTVAPDQRRCCGAIRR